jgi:TonB family protein
MNRLQKKCLVGSMALHALLCAILIVGPAFLSSKQKEFNLPILEVVPDKLTDAPAYGGGNPNAKPPPSPAQPAPLPPPKPAEREIKQPKTESKPPPEPKPTVKAEPEVERAEIKHEKPKPQIKVETKIIKRPTDKTPDKIVKKTEEEDAKAQARAEADARRRTAQQILAKLNGASERLESLSSSTRIEPLGPGGEAFANYGQAVRSIYERRWLKPAQIEETVVVKTTIQIARNGRVLSARVTGPSGNPAVDKSVRKVLDEVTLLPPFPEGSADQTRTFDIDFELKPNRMTG